MARNVSYRFVTASPYRSNVPVVRPRRGPARMPRSRRFSPHTRGRPRCPARLGGGASPRAASFRRRLTTVPPRSLTAVRNGALAYAPSATTHSGWPTFPSHVVAHRRRPAANSNSVRTSGRCGRPMLPRSFRRTYRRARRGRAATPHSGRGPRAASTTPRWPYRNAPPVGPGVGLWWMPAPSLHVRAGTRGRRVVEGEHQPRVVGDERANHPAGEASGDLIRLLAGGGHGGVARAVVVTRAGGADPGGDGAATAGEDGPDEQVGRPTGRARVEDGGQDRKGAARGGPRVRECHRPSRFGWGWLAWEPPSSPTGRPPSRSPRPIKPPYQGLRGKCRPRYI